MPERSYRRFPLRHRIRVSFAAADPDSCLEGYTRNVSIGGILLEFFSRIPLHVAVTFAMTIVGSELIHPIEFAGEGRVVRIEPDASGVGYAVALAFAGPIQLV